ncbi:beta-ketoacyl-ACP synthase III [Streptococcus pseudoporcinus]|uniref:Beta-ketoacyl-[acyl-carrier-protein] synthase III n=1 Tax=Streptococcus pseudoporcinus LQ 940-04 TaxID=875093 RepID=G5K8E7_9STRE|nr:beta-ketoacyl-ACP synthase III [Streptococcus pseudoporcinus]EFR45094.1 3-oxoacyl-(acyl carrier protein) synthase III [Streptococcus pseudoporcinus SPIN 20026]EHI64838.1 3-oxoacyl-(acyl carrier protein) synthase III [Streptococcus pseudoporcinus LQ 940-04]VEF94170.1 3-oxoacyl-ACP synthase [Streptococcus pseudoporcinus]
MPYSKISQAAHYLPNQVVSNEDLASILDTNDEWISSRTGIRKRRISKSETTSDLASQVALQLLEKSGYQAADIDFIIVATISADTIMPSVAAKVQAYIGATKAFAFDMTAACSGFVFALAMADKLIRSGSYQKGIVIGAETLSKSLDWSDRSTAVLFGDGAGGVLLESSETCHFLAESLNTDGKRGSSLRSGQSGLNSPFSDKRDNFPFIRMDGRAIFDFAIRDVSKNIKQLIEDSSLSKENIDYFLLHQANQRILDKMARKIACPREKFLENMMDYGNTSAASIPILLSEAVQDGHILLDGSQIVLLSGFGGGLTWGSLIVKI